MRDAREDRRARHGGAGGVRRARAAGARHRARARGDRARLLRDRDGGDGRSRRAEQHHLDTSRPKSIKRQLLPGVCTGDVDPRRVHDRAARRHRRRELPHERRHQGRQARAERRQDADQPRRRSAVRSSSSAASTSSRAAKASAACWSSATRRASRCTARYHTMGGENLARDPVRQLRAAAGEPDHRARTASASS